MATLHRGWAQLLSLAHLGFVVPALRCPIFLMQLPLMPNYKECDPACGGWAMCNFTKEFHRFVFSPWIPSVRY